jgi:hypothetical protein
MTSTSAEVRSQLIKALEMDLIGAKPDEILPEAPTKWYLSGFLAPYGVPQSDRSDDFGDDEIDEASRTGAGDDEQAPEAAAARKAFFPSSMGVSFLIADGVTKLKAIASWGDYEIIPEEETNAEGKTKQKSASQCKWQRIPKQQTVEITLAEITKSAQQIQIPHSNGLFLSVSIRNITDSQLKATLPIGTRAISIFLVNNRAPAGDSERDRAFIFQAHLEIQSEIPSQITFVPRPDPRSSSNDWDEMVADLQYRHDFEYATGHNVSADYELDDLGQCARLFTTWIPKTDVEKVVASEIAGEYEIETLAQASDVSSLKAMLDPMVEAYQNWILQQRKSLTELSETSQRENTAKALLDNAMITYQRIRKGINAMDDPQVFQAFKLANQAIAISIRQRNSHNSETAPKDVKAPKWRPFQLAFILNNIAGIANPLDRDREIVDLLFFPTGGGKTEAYLGLAAFTLILRRLRDPKAEGSAGLSVLMRYTLRLLTLDQLGRAATLICALETIRQENVDILGKHRFEIGLWVGQTATPNRMGAKGDKNPDSARQRTINFKTDSNRFPSPIPIENCPWCGERFDKNSFSLYPNADNPKDLIITCNNRKTYPDSKPVCTFKGANPLPIVAVDDQIYRKLPAFMIATVDKFANLPWVGETGKLFGKASHYDDKTGNFYSEADQHKAGKALQQYLPPPDLIIQDELHLISGPLGTMVGLYETAIDALSTSYLSSDGEEQGVRVRPKIVASTATVRRAMQQIKALFARKNVDIFPPPSPDRRDSFFAKTVTTSEANGRTYLGIAAQGRSLKVVLLRTYLALLSAAQREWKANGGKDNPKNPADPYMTLLGYFNSLRELGGSRRIVEDEVSTKLQKFSDRRRISDSDKSRNQDFSDRTIRAPLELTSRVSTSEVSDTKRRLELGFAEKDSKDSVDVALATNMISVGLDITRLGLMVVLGQPKTAAEYIQATSRVGRDDQRPGLVITLLNVHRPRDRSHYERFKHWHTIFYRAVEATSVTPFSPRAVDRGLAAITVALARHHYRDLTTPLGAFKILNHHDLNFVIDTIAQRAERHGNFPSEEAEALRKKLRDRTVDLLDTWKVIANERGNLQYQKEDGVAAPALLFDPLDPDLMRQKPNYRKFKAQRSLRDVEKSVNLWIRNPDGIDVEDE